MKFLRNSLYLIPVEEGRQLVVGEGKLEDVPDGTTSEMARDGLDWQDPLVSEMLDCRLYDKH